MNGVIGEILPSALGVAISPIPIIAAILMLLSPKARGTSVGFMIGWLLGIVVAVVVFTLLSAVIPAADPSASKPIAGVIKIILGLALLLLAWSQWRKRPHAGETAATPKWMSAIDSMKPAAALGLGFLLAAVNPKNLLMAVAGGLAIGGSGIAVGQQVIAIVIFVLIAACTVVIPVVAYLLASAKMAGPLDALRVWLLANNATIMTVLLLVIGVVLIGKGIADF
ncbi:GAP family protein [Leifsonia poae]|uniref:Membrane protein n=1 Tax=Leifsonia poae TaxID=110933 RepID=A0A9W6M0J9_9MICO|nr:GAP family protein [Leifsonia poae]GLJ76739.1 membrane protein [Leifsonia poae]